MNTIPPIKKVHVEGDAMGFAQTARILQRLEGLPVKRVKPRDVAEKPQSLNLDKETLRLLSFQGAFLKPCPGTQKYICCGYQILQVGTNCPLDCSYCILQAYFNQPSLRLFVNLEYELEQIGKLIERQPGRIFRIGTGEFTDSLALEPISEWCGILLPFFSKRRNAVLELKTKTDQIKGLLSSKYREKIVVSWSLNSPHVSSREERGAAGIEKRLKAAGQCQREGFTLGFHFDPLIEHPGWKAGYLRTIEMMDKYIDPKGIIWVSLGGLRYMPMLKAIIRRRHPNTHVLDGEFVPGLDGKMRYFKPIRIEMYARIREMLEKWHDDLGLYLCMEGHDVWEKTLGWSPGDTDGLSHFLDRRVVKMFG
jgi:spore photoproduct lyase